MKILDAGDHPLSNADVLDWTKRKRAQLQQEDAEDRAQGLPVANRPKNFLRILERTERELSSPRYPYASNPSAYDGDGRGTAMRSFALAVEDAIQDGLDEEWKEKLSAGGVTSDQISKAYELAQDKKCLTNPELLMIYNHAPSCVEMLQPMIEAVEDRFTPEEQQIIVDLIMKHLRCDESRSTAPTTGQE